TPVPPLGGAGEDARRVQVLADALGELFARKPPLSQEVEDVLVLLVQKEADFLEDGLRVGREDRMLPHCDQAFVQLPGVREVEVAAKGEIARGPGAAAKERMAGAQIVPAARAVAQVPEEQLAAEIEMAFHRGREL